MNFLVNAADPICGRFLKLELERMGLTEAAPGAKDYQLLAAEGLTELSGFRHLKAIIFIDCGLLSVGVPDSIATLILNRPFPLEELREFVKRQLERADEDEDLAGLILDDNDSSVTYGDVTVKLTGREYALFSYLHARPDETISRSELLHNLWLDENARDTNIVDVYVRFLRSKLDERFGMKMIRAVRGAGYYFTFEDTMKKDGLLTEEGTQEENG